MNFSVCWLSVILMVVWLCICVFNWWMLWVCVVLVVSSRKRVVECFMGEIFIVIM